MNVVGFDLGNQNCVVAVARNRGIDVLNDESKCETPAIVCFGEKQRFFGTAGAASSMMMNPKNTISQIKRLIGRPYSDPELQQDLKALPFSVTEGPDGFPLIHAHCLGETRTFTPTQVMGMVFSNMKTIAEKNLNAAVVDYCIGIPIYFTELQRRAVMDAATIAGLHPLRLIHETTATALLYGIYKTDLPENAQLNVAFVDIGHASMQVCIAGFKKGQLKILAHSFDRCLGGRDFDEALFQHFAKKFKAEYKIDVFQNPRACLRLRAACEKLKKVLSANPEAPMNLECLMDEKDARGFIKRDEFEQIITPILERVKQPLEKALSEARLTVDNINAVEVVGSGSRVPAVIKILTEFFGKEPRHPMNASECVSKGCALECAILSPTYKVREFQVQESFPFSIALTWKGSAEDSHIGNVENQQSRIVFPKGNPIPSLKALTFYRSGTFTLDLHYADVSELQAPPKISTYTIGPFQTTNGERAKVKVKARLNLHGIVSIESADLIEEEVEVLVSKEPLKIDTDKAHLVEASKKKLKKFNVPVSELVYGAMLRSDVQKAVEKELEMVLQDRIVEETKDKRDAVDAYVYDMRNKRNLKFWCQKESSKMDMDKTPVDAPPTNDSDLNMMDVSVTENGAPEAGDNPVSSDNNHVHAKTNEDLVEMFDNTQHQNIGTENEDEVTSSTSTNQRSNVWDCFEQLPVGPDGVKKASCIACGKVYVANPNSGTSNMKQHILTCFNFNQSDRPQKSARLDQAVYREKMAIAIVKHNYPFSYVEHDATRQLHKFLHQGVNPITRNTAREDVIRIYEREKTTLKQKLEKVTSRICLTSNLWSSITTDRYMALTAHYVDESWVLRKRVLNFRAIPPPYSSPILAEYMINLLRDWGIENKIFTITSGYEKYHDGLIDSLRGHFRLNNVLVCDGDYMHVHCGAHILTLIVQTGLKTIEGSIEKLRDSVKYIRGSFTRKLKFAECIAQLSLQCGRHVCQDIITRWNTTYLMLDCALIYRRAYVQLELVDSDFKTNLSQEEWTRVARITRLLKPLYDITTLFSGGSYPTSNLYFQKVWKIQLYIQEEIHSSDPIISRMAEDMKTEFDKYWETYRMILSFAVILDPRYKVKLVEYCFSKLDMEDRVREEKLKSILDGLDKLYKEYEIPNKKMHDSSVGGSSDVGIDPLDDLDGFESFKSQFGRVERDKMQLKMYLAEPVLDRRQNIDILQFWKDNEWRYPQLALMARDILSIPITTVVPNSSFSIGGHVLSKYGSSLLSPETEVLLCTRDWLFDVEDEKEMEEELIEDIEALIPTLQSSNR